MLSSKQLKEASVTGFRTPLPYYGSLVWWLLTLAVEVQGLYGATAGVWKSSGYGFVDGFWIFIVSFHCFFGVLMTVDAMYFNHRFWPLQAVSYALQLSNAAALSALLGYAFSLADDQQSMRSYLTAAALFMTILFTASQLAVTVEYLARKSVPAAQTSTAATRRVGRTRSSVARAV